MNQSLDDEKTNAVNLVTQEGSFVANEVKNSQLRGIWAPCLTPLNSDLSIDLFKLTSHINWLLENGCDGVVLFGTTGEASSFSASERMSALEHVVESGISCCRLMVGNGFPSVQDSVSVTQHALSVGCEQVLMVPPYFYKTPNLDGVSAAYRYVFDRINGESLRVILYHYPKLSMVPITHSLIHELTRTHGNLIAGVKDSTGDWSSMKGFIQEFPELSIFPGSDSYLLAALKIGGVGTITATADINPTGIAKVYDLWSKRMDAVAAQDAANRVREVVFKYPLSSALKAVQAHFCFDESWKTVRPPLTPLSESHQSRLLAELEEAGFEIPKST